MVNSNSVDKQVIKCRKAIFKKADNQTIVTDTRLVDGEVYEASWILANGINVNRVSFRCVGKCNARLHFRRVVDTPHFALCKGEQHKNNCINLFSSSNTITGIVDNVSIKSTKEIKDTDLNKSHNKLNKSHDKLTTKNNRLKKDNATKSQEKLVGKNIKPSEFKTKSNKINHNNQYNTYIEYRNKLSAIHTDYSNCIESILSPREGDTLLYIKIVRNRKIKNQVVVCIEIQESSLLERVYKSLSSVLATHNIEINFKPNNIHISKNGRINELIYRCKELETIRFNGATISSLIGNTDNIKIQELER